jgi:hypothetical protein
MTLHETDRASSRSGSELAMMAALARAISRATRYNIDVEILKILMVFAGAAALLSLAAAMIYRQALKAALL